MGRVRIGTCSWKFPSWAGLVYSAKSGINYLQEYALQYDTVEIDQWFWSLFDRDVIGLPDPQDVETYRQSVRDDFRFTAKAPNSVTLTHFYRRAKSDPLLANPHFLSSSLLVEFLSRLDPLQDTMGPILFQFEYLNQRKMRSQDDFQGQFASFVRQLPRTYQYAVEIRNPNYLNHAYFGFLSQNDLIPIFLQGYWMPPITAVYERYRPFVLEHEVAVIRLLGPDREGMEEQTGKRWNEIVSPRDKELAAITDMVRDLANQGLDVYLNVNNHYEGSAPLTIERVKQLL